MTDEFWKMIGVIVTAISGSRILSHFEHKKSAKVGEETNKSVNEIKIYMNGEFEKRLAEEKRKWEQEQSNQDIPKRN